MKKIYALLGSLVFTGTLAFSQADSSIFNFTGAMQTFVVPSCVTSITFDIMGASGGGDVTVFAPGGRGGRVQGTLAVTPGQTLNIFVGGKGDSLSPGGYNGGAAGAGGGPGYPGGGGGGASDIRIGGITFSDRVIVAGGGGGSTENAGVAIGGPGGDLVGGTGGAGGNAWGCTNLIPATGGTQSAGGIGGTSASCAWNGSDGTFGIGGIGYPVYRCGGGGGGWYGGGGAHNGGGGGGGSSYTNSALVSGVIHSQGVHIGNGQVILYYTPGSVAGTAATTATSGNLCAFDTINFFTTGSIGNVQWWVMDTINLVWSPFGSGNPYNPGSPNNGDIGAYQFIAIVTNGSCPSDTSNIINLNVRPTPIVILGNDSTQCGGSITLDAGNPGETYLWNSFQTTQMITVNASGSYIATVTTQYGCVGRDTVLLTINPLPAVSGTAASITPCFDDALVGLTGSPVGGTWTGTGVVGNNFNPATAGVGPENLVYTFIDGNGCQDTAEITIVVNACVGITEGNNLSSDVALYPNPNNGTFTINVNANVGDMLIEIFDVEGRMVFTSLEKNVQAGFSKPVSMTEMPNGIYLVKLNANGEVAMHRLSISK